MKRVRSIGWAAVVLLLLALTAWQGVRLTAVRQAKLAASTPGSAAVALGLSGFRGIASEILWYRVTRLQDKGQYPEIVQLTRWITRLDPHAVDAWSYLTWNLAYNISVMYSAPESRWRWVSNALELLQQDALRENPDSAKIYREITWLYAMKIGSDLDSAHLYYKRQLAEQPPPADAAMRQEIESVYGPMNWKEANAHAVYWATLGLKHAKTPGEVLELERMRMGALVATYLARPTPALLRALLTKFDELNRTSAHYQEIYHGFLETAYRRLNPGAVTEHLTPTVLRQRLTSWPGAF